MLQISENRMYAFKESRNVTYKATFKKKRIFSFSHFQFTQIDKAGCFSKS